MTTRMIITIPKVDKPLLLFVGVTGVTGGGVSPETNMSGPSDFN